MAIKTVTSGSKIYRDDLLTIRSDVSSAASAWGVSGPASVSTTKPIGTNWDSIKDVSTNIFNAAVTAGISMAYNSINLNHTRSSVLDALDINILGGNPSGSSRILRSGLSTFVVTSITPPCSQCSQCSQCNDSPCSECSHTPCSEECCDHTTPCNDSPCGDCSHTPCSDECYE